MYFQRRVKMKKLIMVSVERGGSTVGMISGSFFLPLSCFWVSLQPKFTTGEIFYIIVQVTDEQGYREKDTHPDLTFVSLGS